MSASIIVIISLIVLSLASMGYIFAYRGQERYVSLTEYLRKGWPVFSLFNCFLYLVTQKRARWPIMDVNLFPELREIQAQWPIIREEALALQNSNVFDDITTPDQGAYYDVGFRTFYKYGWRKFYILWYGYQHPSAQAICPRTQAILSKIPCINGAMFSILPPHSQLTRHLDPVACSLRYHLGLATPNQDSCFISVDGQKYSWRDGDALLFDETYIHYVRNDTDEHRLILMCDVERPMNLMGRTFNFFYKHFMRGTLVPNTQQDATGWISGLFRKITPIMSYGKTLKKSNPKSYRLSKAIINLIVLCILFGLIAFIVRLLQLAL